MLEDGKSGRRERDRSRSGDDQRRGLLGRFKGGRENGVAGGHWRRGLGSFGANHSHAGLCQTPLPSLSSNAPLGTASHALFAAASTPLDSAARPPDRRPCKYRCVAWPRDTPDSLPDRPWTSNPQKRRMRGWRRYGPSSTPRNRATSTSMASSAVCAKLITVRRPPAAAIRPARADPA